MNCPYCGQEIDINDLFCSSCGAKIERNTYSENSTTNVQTKSAEDTGNLGFALLSFFFFVAGIALFFCFRKEKPKTAKQIGIAVILAMVLRILVMVLYGVILYVAVRDGNFID